MEISVTIRFPLPRDSNAVVSKLEVRARQLHLWHVTAYAPALLCGLAVGSHLSSICAGRKPLNSLAPHVHVRLNFPPGLHGIALLGAAC